MIKENSNEDFSFQIEGKDYIISEKNELAKKDQGKKIYVTTILLGSSSNLGVVSFMISLLEPRANS